MANINRTPLDAATEIVNALIDEKAVTIMGVVDNPSGGHWGGIDHQKVIEAFKEIFDVCDEASQMKVHESFGKKSAKK